MTNWLNRQQLVDYQKSGRDHQTLLDHMDEDVESHNLTLTEAVNVAQNHPLWRLMAVSGAMHS